MKYVITDTIPYLDCQNKYEIVVSGYYGDGDRYLNKSLFTTNTLACRLFAIYMAMEDNGFEECRELEEYCGDFDLLDAYEHFPRDSGWECDTGILPTIEKFEVYFYNSRMEKRICVFSEFSN